MKHLGGFPTDGHLQVKIGNATDPEHKFILEIKIAS